MLIKGALTSAAAIAFAGCAMAADVNYYPPTLPQAGSPLYQPASIGIAGDLSAAVGFWFSGKSNAFIDIDGRLAFPLGGSFVIEPELGVWSGFGGGGIATGVIHFYKNQPNGAIGAFAAISGWSGGGPSAFSVGGELKGYLPNADLTGQISWTGVSGSGFLQLGGFADWYVSPVSKFRGGIEVAFGSGSTWGDASLMYLRRLAGGPTGNLDGFVKGGAFFGGGTAGYLEAGLKGSFGPPAPTVRAQDEQVQFSFRPLLWDY